MIGFKSWQSTTAALISVGLTAGIVAPIVLPSPVFAQTSFSDVSSDYWARTFIQELAARDVIKGFPDGTFRPNEPVTRAQFAAMVSKAFNKARIRNAASFVDVPSNYWATNVIGDAYAKGFMSGYPGNVFNPGQNIPRVQVLVALANGLNYSASSAPENTLTQFYNDGSAVPGYAVTPVASATERRIVVNYPNVRYLNPNQTATRADVAAFVYQALQSEGQVSAISSPYIVGAAATTPPPTAQNVIPAGTTIPVRYEKDKILVAKDETVPVTLLVAQNIANAQGRVVIPAGSQIVGDIRPAQGGAQFVARELVLSNGRRTPISASSQVVTRTEEINKGASTGRVIQDAALGAAAAAAISAVTGDRAIATEEVLGGAGVGALIGLFLGQDRVSLISINPDTDLSLRLGSDLSY